MSDPRDDPTDGETPRCKVEWDAADEAEAAYGEAMEQCREAAAEALLAEAEYLLACVTHGNLSTECMIAMFNAFHADDAWEAACDAVDELDRERNYRERLVADCLSGHKFTGNVWLPHWTP
ncbi:MAG: hypothetical protein H6806_10940 [Planctomycetes bacterium]|nr:hypothetical protein [Planctomycetota bacterium]